VTVEPLVQIDPPEPRRAQPSLPLWLRKGRTHFESVDSLKRQLRQRNLHTVCESARCPNIHECFHRGAATFMILGNLCTRGCGFCSVPKGSPAKREFSLDPAEPRHVAEMAAEMKLKYVVITSVNRDDLDDGGSIHFAETVRAVRRALPNAQVEVLTPDFEGNMDAVARVLDAGPHVFNHNMETVGRLYRRVRPQANYRQSLDVLRFAKQYRPAALTKSGLMVGLGETREEIMQVMDDLRAAGVDFLTIGQYLQPTKKHAELKKFWTPDEFKALEITARAKGFLMVSASPLTRSSYHADTDFAALKAARLSRQT